MHARIRVRPVTRPFSGLFPKTAASITGKRGEDIMLRCKDSGGIRCPLTLIGILSAHSPSPYKKARPWRHLATSISAGIPTDLAGKINLADAARDAFTHYYPYSHLSL